MVPSVSEPTQGQAVVPPSVHLHLGSKPANSRSSRALTLAAVDAESRPSKRARPCTTAMLLIEGTQSGASELETVIWRFCLARLEADPAQPARKLRNKSERQRRI